MNAFAHFFNVYILLYKPTFVKTLFYEISIPHAVIFVSLAESIIIILQVFLKKIQFCGMLPHPCSVGRRVAADSSVRLYCNRKIFPRSEFILPKTNRAACCRTQFRPAACCRSQFRPAVSLTIVFAAQLILLPPDN